MLRIAFILPWKGTGDGRSSRYCSLFVLSLACPTYLVSIHLRRSKVPELKSLLILLKATRLWSVCEVAYVAKSTVTWTGVSSQLKINAACGGGRTCDSVLGELQLQTVKSNSVQRVAEWSLFFDSVDGGSRGLPDDGSMLDFLDVLLDDRESFWSLNGFLLPKRQQMEEAGSREVLLRTLQHREACQQGRLLLGKGEVEGLLDDHCP